MAEDRNTENFALGLIVAAIIYFIFRRQLDKALGVSSTKGNGGAGGGSGAGKSPSGSCGGGCGGCGSGASLPENPGTSVGNQSYNSPNEAFQSSTVAAVTPTDFFTSRRTSVGGAVFS
jgi:hypothetical protein